jgi:uncharacterized protein YndB with AHSA1/START domain
MTSGEFEITIDAPAERVWPWVADLGRHAEFSPTPYSVEWTGGDPNAVGSRYRSVGVIPGDKHHVNEGEILENDPPRRFVLRAHDKEGSYLNTFEVAPQGDATKVTFRLDFEEMHGMSALLVPMIFPLVGKRQIRDRMALLKTRVESSA